jgi:Ni/Co efflux regulator RcnB
VERIEGSGLQAEGGHPMAWIVLIIAALIDVAMAVALKDTDGCEESSPWHSLRRLHWNRDHRHHDDRGLALSGECLARTAHYYSADLNRYCRSQIAESLTFRI